MESKSKSKTSLKRKRNSVKVLESSALLPLVILNHPYSLEVQKGGMILFLCIHLSIV